MDRYVRSASTGGMAVYTPSEASSSGRVVVVEGRVCEQFRGGLAVWYGPPDQRLGAGGSLAVTAVAVDGRAVLAYAYESGELVPDPLGSTAALLDNTQTKVAETEFWPYGETRTATGSPSPLGFDGGDWDLNHYASSSPASTVDPTGLVVPLLPVACAVACGACGVCLLGHLAACSDCKDWMCWKDCLARTISGLPWFAKAICGASCAGCLACLGGLIVRLCRSRKIPRPPSVGPCTPTQKRYCQDVICAPHVTISCIATGRLLRPHSLCGPDVGPWSTSDGYLPPPPHTTVA